MEPPAPRVRDAAFRGGSGPCAARRVAVIGGGWAGLAAAVEATRRGHRVTLFEMASQLGGRAREIASQSVDGAAHDAASAHASLDNGQHILIGAYVETLALLREIGIAVDTAFLRTPLCLTYPDGHGLRLPRGAPLVAFAVGVWRQRGWRPVERLALLATATRWALCGFRAVPTLTVEALTAGLPRAVRDGLIDPLCVAALNTPAAEASAAIFLRVLRDALFAGRGSADLLLPRISLSALLPTPAAQWLDTAGATVRLRHRVRALTADDTGWSIDGERFDCVVLATPPAEAARLTASIAPVWSQAAAALCYEPIVTVYLQAEGARLAEPMLALHADDARPAQFVFDRGQLGGPPGLLACVISGAAAWLERGIDATVAATLAQMREALGDTVGALTVMRTLTEKRATFRCTPNLARPPMRIAAGLHAGGDHVAGPYPATLEGAVRSALAAVRGFD